MNTKQLKYLSLFEEMSKADILGEATAKKYFTSFINLDYSLALEIWDYLATTRETELSKNADKARVLGGSVLELFYKNGARTAKAIYELPTVRKTVYQYSPSAGENAAFNSRVDLLSGNKTDQADEILKCLVKNERIQYGPVMKNVLERLFIEILKKNPSKKLEMSRKLSTLLLSYVSKIKTDERAMLEQRIRETM